MKKRFKLPKGKSKKLFKRTVNRTHKKNLQAVPMRGGFRM